MTNPFATSSRILETVELRINTLIKRNRWVFTRKQCQRWRSRLFDGGIPPGQLEMLSIVELNPEQAGYFRLLLVNKVNGQVCYVL